MLNDFRPKLCTGDNLRSKRGGDRRPYITCMVLAQVAGCPEPTAKIQTRLLSAAGNLATTVLDQSYPNTDYRYGAGISARLLVDCIFASW
jgi:hypothetical protein